MNYDQRHPGRFIKAGLLDGRAVTLTIKEAKHEKLGEEDDQSETILAFVERPLELVLNVTNDQCISAMFGEEDTNWPGHRVTLVPAETRFGRDTVPCIRIAGSPELKAPLPVTVHLKSLTGKTREVKMELQPTGKVKSTQSTDVLEPAPVPLEPLEDDIDAALDAPTPLDKMTRAAGLGASDGKLM